MTKQELMELNQTAYDTVVKKLFLMEPFAGNVHRPLYELYFKGEITTIKVTITSEPWQKEVHTFTVYDTKYNLNYGNRTLYNYVFPEVDYQLNKEFSEFVQSRAFAYQNANDAKAMEEAERQARQDRIDLAMRLKNFVSSF